MPETTMPHDRVWEHAVHHLDTVRRFKAQAVADGCTVPFPIHDEITIEAPSEQHARRILSQLARLMRPSLPSMQLAVDGDQVARFLLSNYGMPARGNS